jgi:predicted TPR repeat methyltransferase
MEYSSPPPPRTPKDRFVHFLRYQLTFLDKPAKLLDDLLYKFNNLAETNYALGEALANTGHFRDAVLRLKVALWLAPNHPPSLYLLGCCYISLGEKVKAKEVLRRLVQITPEDENATFMLATLDPSLIAPARQPTVMPAAIAINYFTGAAATYEADQQEQGYKGHQFADATLWEWLDRRRKDYHVLELGCGTGLCGTLLAEHAEELMGVDFCAPMLEQAQTKRRPDGRRVYTETTLLDIRYFAADMQTPRYDAVVAAHVLNYVGEIAGICDGVMRGLRNGGYFVFQVERYGVDGRFGLIPDRGRFGHSDGYVRTELARVGLQLLANDLVRVYPDYDLVQYVARKPEAE